MDATLIHGCVTTMHLILQHSRCHRWKYRNIFQNRPKSLPEFFLSFAFIGNVCTKYWLNYVAKHIFPFRLNRFGSIILLNCALELIISITHRTQQQHLSENYGGYNYSEPN